MNSKKQTVIDFLQNLPENVYDRYNEAFNLYRQNEAKEFTAERTYNQGYSESNLKNLLYDLQKVYGITDLELLEKITPAAAEEVIELVPEVKTFEQLKNDFVSTGDALQKAHDEKLPAEEIKVLFDAHLTATQDFNSYLDANPDAREFVELEDKYLHAKQTWDSVDANAPKEVWEPLSDALAEAKKNFKNYTAEKAGPEDFTPAPASEERKKLRDDFPFLKEEDCPLELKALVTDKINAYEEYVVAHNQLLKHANKEIELSEEQVQELTKKSVEAFELNREIYEELNYYRANGKVLGKHPIFKTLTLKREVNSMSQDALLSFRDSSPKFFSTKKSDLTKAGKDQVKVDKINASVAARTAKLELVNIRLGSSKK